MESFRLEKKSALVRNLIIGTPITIAASVGMLFLVNMLLKMENVTSEGSPLWLVLFPLVIGFVIIFRPSTLYKKRVKDEILPLVCQFFGSLQYEGTGGISSDAVASSQLFKRYNRFHAEDYIHGEYESVPMRLQELTLKRKRKKSEELVFSGIYFEAEFPKTFKGETYILRERGRFANWSRNIVDNDGKTLEQVKLEDPRFESIFEVYSNDQVEARYLLTTSLMERLLDLMEIDFGGYTKIGNLNGKPRKNYIRGSFKENKITLAISIPGNLFESHSIWKPAYDLAHFHAFLAQMNALFQIIHTLKLNQRIGL